VNFSNTYQHSVTALRVGGHRASCPLGGEFVPPGREIQSVGGKIKIASIINYDAPVAHVTTEIWISPDVI